MGLVGSATSEVAAVIVVAWTLAALFFAATCALTIVAVRLLRNVFDLQHESHMRYWALLEIDKLYWLDTDVRDEKLLIGAVKEVLARYDRDDRLDWPDRGLFYCRGCRECGKPVSPARAHTCGAPQCEEKQVRRFLAGEL
jgi:hypothetical protein